MNYAKIGTWEAIMLVCVGILNHLLSNLPKKILSSCRFSFYFECSLPLCTNWSVGFSISSSF